MPSLKRAPFPSVAQAALLFVALMLCEYVIAAALHDANRWLGLSEAQEGVLSTVLGNACVFLALMHVLRLGWRGLFHPSPASPAATFMLVVPPVLLLVPALTLSLIAAVNLVIAFFPMSPWEEALFSRMADGSVAATVAVCIVAPLCEEMLFRGIVLRGFLRRYGRWQAIAMSAVLFGAAHLNIYQFVVGLVLGTVLGWLYERTRSLIPCIALHASYNAGSIFIGDWPDRWSDTGVVIVLLVAFFAAVGGGFTLRRMLNAPAPR